jgi:hypothetical protein
MRIIVGSGIALLLTLAVSAEVRVARASEGQRAVDEANVALAVQPPRREAARSALERATAADDDPAAVSEAYFRLGALDEEEAAFAQAVTHYRQSLAAKPVSSGVQWARNASKRMQWLSARSEGDFAPLARLHRFARDPALAADPEAVAALARDTEAFPPGIVRAESRMLVASAWLGPLRRPRDALRLFRLVATDPTGGQNLRFAERGLVDALIADGQLDEAATEAQAHAVQLDPEVVHRLQRHQRRRTLVRVAQIEVAVFVGFLAVARWKRRSRRAAPRSTSNLARIAGALWGAASVIAAAFVVLSALAPSYLERIGL